MEGFDAVIDQPEVVESEQVETPQPEGDQPEQQSGESDKKFSVRFSNWLKSTKDTATDPEVQKFARYGKDLEGRDRALRELYPNGVNDVREVKAALDGLSFGEHKGIEAIGAIQDQIRDYEQSDELLASGDPKVLDLFGDEFNEGLGKLTPAILDRIQQSNPEAYSAAILPHLVGALRTSPMIQDFNGIVDVLNEQPPQWLTPDQKQHWVNEKFQKIVAHANGMATWLNAQDQAAKGKGLPANGNRTGAPDKLSEERQQFERQQQDFHWKTNIVPELNKHAEKSFNDLFGPYDKRLKLTPEARQALAQDFVNQVKAKAVANRQYSSQINRYHSQKNPDPAVVSNLARVEWDRHAKGVMDALVNQRYRPFLGSKQSPTPSNGAKPVATNGNGPRVVSVKPNQSDIDFPNTPVDWLNTKADGSKQYRMKDGKTVIFRPNR